MPKYKKILILSALMVLVMVIAGCSWSFFGGSETTDIDEAAIAYVTDIANNKWDAVLKRSTGDQLAIYTQLVPILEKSKQTSELKIAEVVDKAVSDNKNLAFVTVHYVRTVNLPNYGSVMDDKQVLLSMKKIDGEWKVFRMDVVTDLKTMLDN